MEVNNCPTCGGKVEFSPSDKALKCIKCGNIFKIELSKNVQKRPINEKDNDEGYEKWEKSSRSYHCKNCGAQIVLNSYEMATKCQYCNTSSLVPLKSLPGLKPDIILPFKISKREANETFKLKIKKRMFLPREFKKNLPKTEVGATYISAFTFACYVSATFTAIEVIRKEHTNSKGESYEEVRRIPVSGTQQNDFPNIVVEASDKLTQSEINSILPFNFSESFDFNSDFTKGYSVGYYNQTVNEAFEEAKVIALRKIENLIRSRYRELENLKIYPVYRDEKYNYALLPIYFINYQYKDKNYLNLMNGQNGAVGGKVPRSKVKITFFTIFCILLVVGLPLLIFILTSL